MNTNNQSIVCITHSLVTTPNNQSFNSLTHSIPIIPNNQSSIQLTRSLTLHSATTNRFVVRRSSFVVRRSSFVVRRSSFGRSSNFDRRTSNIVGRFVLHNDFTSRPRATTRRPRTFVRHTRDVRTTPPMPQKTRRRRRLFGRQTLCVAQAVIHSVVHSFNASLKHL